MARKIKLERIFSPANVFVALGSVTFSLMLCLFAFAQTRNGLLVNGTPLPQDCSPKDNSQMRPLEFLSGDWMVTLDRYNTEKGKLEMVSSQLRLTCTPVGGKKIMMLSLSGTLQGRYYEAGGVIYYDPLSNQYRKIWSDNIVSSPVTLVGELQGENTGTMTLDNESISLRMYNSDRTLVECVQSFTNDSAAFSILDGTSNAELTRFTFHRSPTNPK